MVDFAGDDAEADEALASWISTALIVSREAWWTIRTSAGWKPFLYAIRS